MIKTIEFEQDFSPDELAKVLRHAGFPEDATLKGIIAGLYDDFDPDSSISLDCAIDEEDAIERLSDEAILDAARDLGGATDERALEDGIRYVRSGEHRLAAAMFGRVFEAPEMAAVERALS